jgi:hypothetical protein
MKTTMNNMQPYHNEGLNKVYQLLFCDDITLYQSNNNAPAVYLPQQRDKPWEMLLAKSVTEDDLHKIVADKNTETRIKILAWRRLAADGHEISEKELLGVIIEVGLQEGLDTLAAYSDGTARYINHAESMIIWETGTDISNDIIKQLFSDSEIVIGRIGAWDKARLPPPKVGEIRLSFLVSDGLYFGQGPFEVLQKDAMGGPVIQSGLALLQFLTSQKQNSNHRPA